MKNPDLAEHFSLVFYDNSPQPQALTMAADFPIHYVHDPSNGGLATAYNFALTRAESEQREWLLLLDQDTSPTREFIFELVQAATSLQGQPEVAAIVPKLMVDGVVHSPAIPFIEQLRRQFRPQKPMGQDVVGILQQPVCPYNSGSTLRVSALRSMGGFPQEFWLDYLDHAVFHALLLRGYRVYMMLATLMHEASYSDLDSVPYWRLHNILMAQTLYVKQLETLPTGCSTGSGCCATAGTFENPAQIAAFGERPCYRLFGFGCPRIRGHPSPLLRRDRLLKMNWPEKDKRLLTCISSFWLLSCGPCGAAVPLLVLFGLIAALPSLPRPKDTLSSWARESCSLLCRRRSSRRPARGKAVAGSPSADRWQG